MVIVPGLKCLKKHHLEKEYFLTAGETGTEFFAAHCENSM